MISEFEPVAIEILCLLSEWKRKLTGLPLEVISERRNSQDRTIRQILGHMIDSASNNTHRIIHLQYQPSPLHFPDYATRGNNDRWIAIQNYQEEKWPNLINFWRYSNLHLVHVIKNIDPSKLSKQWLDGHDELVSLRDMVKDYLPHFKLHLDEIAELIGED